MFENTFLRGIHDSLASMEYRFHEFFFLLRGYPNMVGHMGILGPQFFSSRKKISFRRIRGKRRIDQSERQARN